MTSADGTSRRIARFVAEARFSDFPEEVKRKASHALLDGLGVSLAATTLGEGCSAFQEHALQQQAKAESRVWGTGQKSSAQLAAFANGALSHALDFEDTHDRALVHPNAAVIPAAVAAAEAKGEVTGSELLRAIVVGCDVVCRLGLALRVALDEYAWYPPPILSAFGASAAVASIYKLNAEQVLDAFSLTLLQATCSAEIKYNPHSIIRAVRDAFPAQAGVIAAQMAKRGARGFEQPFEGKAGFFAAFARGNYEASELTSELNERFEISQLSFKPWPSCRGTHLAIELLGQLIDRNSIDPERIERIEVFGNDINRMLAEPIDSKRRPTTSIDAKFSIHYCLAYRALHSSLGLQAFFAEAMNDPRIHALADKVNYNVDSTLGRGAGSMTKGAVRISMMSGEHYEANGDNAYGCPERPLSESDLVKKFTQCCEFSSRAMEAGEAKQFAASVLNLEQARDLEHALFRFL